MPKWHEGYGRFRGEELAGSVSKPPSMIRSRLVPCFLGAAILLGACSGDDDATGVTVPDDEVTTSTTTTTGSTTTDPDAEVKAAIEQAYHDQWDAYIEILSDPDPTNPLIEQHFTGAAKERLLDLVSAFIRDGYIARLPTEPSLFQPQIQRLAVDGDEATVIECTVDGLMKVRRATGEIVDDEVLKAHLANTFVLSDGRWKVESTVSAPPGETACD